MFVKTTERCLMIYRYKNFSPNFSGDDYFSGITLLKVMPITFVVMITFWYFFKVMGEKWGITCSLPTKVIITWVITSHYLRGDEFW